MKCPNCGKEIANDSQFCEFCGTKVVRTGRSSDGKPGMKWLWLVLGLIGLVVLGWCANNVLFRLVLLIVAVALIVLLIRKFVMSRK